MKYLSCDEAGFMSLSCELTCVTYETLKRDGFVSYIWRCTGDTPDIGAYTTGVCRMKKGRGHSGPRFLRTRCQGAVAVDGSSSFHLPLRRPAKLFFVAAAAECLHTTPTKSLPMIDGRGKGSCNVLATAVLRLGTWCNHCGRFIFHHGRSPCMRAGRSRRLNRSNRHGTWWRNYDRSMQLE